ncbi:MAG: hypothetical protein EZS28_053883 [Streblomastix strix]|uniref:Uncharacterized protein n=1 Tax=Streblomastix strix TaxID=222440 RepID=A0A5J4QYC6_9EUKA|nr:MAG: hypothetical protein EZS28_053883 [Streblomastix strix]
MQEKQHKFCMHTERHFQQIEMQERQHLLQTAQFRAKQGLLEQKPMNIQTAPSTQFQGNPIREPKVEKKGRKTPVRGKVISTNTSIVANDNQIEDQQR